MRNDARFRILTATAALAVGLGLAGYAPAGAAAGAMPTKHHEGSHHGHHHKGHAEGLPGGYKHLVVIYEENHSFDNLYGTWGDVRGQHVDGLADATHGQHAPRSHRTVTPYACLQQVDVNLASPPLSNTCQDPAHAIPASHFANDVFDIDDYIRPDGPDLPGPGKGPAPVERRAQGLTRRSARWLHPRPRAPLLPGAVPDRRRQAGPLHHRLRRGRPDPGRVRDPAAADLPLPAQQGRSQVRDRRPVLPGRVRRLVPQPPVADRGASAGRHRPGSSDPRAS